MADDANVNALQTERDEAAELLRQVVMDTWGACVDPTCCCSMARAHRWLEEHP